MFFRKQQHATARKAGPIWALLVLATSLLTGRMAIADTYLVTSLEDDGPGTLRQAILDANAHPGSDTIQFALPTGGINGIRTLAPLSPLPPLTDPGTTIDATTQAGYAAVHLPRVEIIGTEGSLTDFIGLTISAANCQVKGLCINRCGQTGIYLTDTALNARIEDCFLGTDANGELALGSTTGIRSDGASGIAIRRCLLSANSVGAVVYNRASGLLLEDCLVGTDVYGDSPLGNQIGIVFYGAAGATVHHCLFGANAGTALYFGPGSDQATVTDSTFGLGIYNGVVGNEEDALTFDDAASGVVQNCLFAFSGLSGVRLTGTQTTGVRIQSSSFYLNFAGIRVENGAQGNTLGGATVTAGLILSGNFTDGVTFAASAGAGNRLQNSESSQNLVSGVGAYAGDQTISGCLFSRNLADGVTVGAEAGQPYAERVVITQSGFHENNALGIRLDSNSGGVGVGGNHLTPAPTLSAATVGGGAAVAQGSLAARPNTTYTVELFASGALDDSGSQQGERYLGSAIVTTDAGGNATFFVSAITYVDASEYLSATATGPDGTSEFSGAVVPTLAAPPVLTSLSPSSAVAGSPATLLTVNGSGFLPTSVVQWNGVALPTTYVSSTQLTAMIPVTDLASAGTAAVTVFTPPAGGGVSAPLTFTITNPAPVPTQLRPDKKTVGDSGFILEVDGDKFVPGSIIRWNGQDRVTTFVNGGKLTTPITSADLATAATISVTVFNPGPGGGESSPLTFTVENPVPAVSGINPSSVYAGSSDIDVVVTGVNFVAGSRVLWNGSARATSFISATQILVHLTADDLAAAGTFLISVVNPSPGGGASNSARFIVIGIPQVVIASASAVRLSNAVRVTLTLKNIGSATLMNGKLKTALLDALGTSTVLPLNLAPLNPGATSAGIVLDFPVSAGSGNKVLSVNISGGGRTYNASRRLLVP